MELRQGKVSITLDELCRFRKMGQYQAEQFLTEAMRLGYQQGYTDSKTELCLQTESVQAELSAALEDRDRRWQNAVGNAMQRIKGISRKRKELLRTEIEREKADICRR